MRIINLCCNIKKLQRGKLELIPNPLMMELKNTVRGTAPSWSLNSTFALVSNKRSSIRKYWDKENSTKNQERFNIRYWWSEYDNESHNIKPTFEDYLSFQTMEALSEKIEIRNAPLKTQNRANTSICIISIFEQWHSSSKEGRFQKKSDKGIFMRNSNHSKIFWWWSR